MRDMRRRRRGAEPADERAGELERERSVRRGRRARRLTLEAVNRRDRLVEPGTAEAFAAHHVDLTRRHCTQGYLGGEESHASA
jgi:hypothetical protein